MKNKHPGLRAQFVCLAAIAGIISAVTFFLLYTCGNVLGNQYFAQSDFQKRSVEKRIIDLQKYVSENNLSAKDSAKITKWAQKQPIMLMEIYRSNVLLYTSSAPDELVDREGEFESPYYDWLSYYEIEFSDGIAEVVIYADDTYRWFSYMTIACLVVAFCVFLLIFSRGIRGLVRYICQLSYEIRIMEGGDLDIPITLTGEHELTDLAQSLDSMRMAFKEQREQESRIVQANQAMITAMSHDLRTPLTTLQIYIDILRYKKYDPHHLEDYLEKIDAKAKQIKQLSESLFEYSLVTRQQSVQLETPILFRQVFHDILSEAVAHLSQMGFSFDLRLNWPVIGIAVYPQYIKRLLDNISSNIMKYAEPSVPIMLEVFPTVSGGKLCVENAIKDGPRDHDSTKIGIANMSAMMETMNGNCTVIRTDEKFRVELSFPARE